MYSILFTQKSHTLRRGRFPRGRGRFSPRSSDMSVSSFYEISGQKGNSSSSTCTKPLLCGAAGAAACGRGAGAFRLGAGAAGLEPGLYARLPRPQGPVGLRLFPLPRARGRQPDAHADRPAGIRGIGAAFAALPFSKEEAVCFFARVLVIANPQQIFSLGAKGRPS